LNKIVSIKNTNAIFLAVILVAGTFAAIFPSFIIIGVNAQDGLEYYDGMGNRYNSYEPELEYHYNTQKKEYNSYEPELEYHYNTQKKEYNSYEPEYEMYDYKKSYRNGYYEQPEYPSYKPAYKPQYQSYSEKHNYKSSIDSSNSISINKLKEYVYY
jgi:hypothetical protein